MSVRVDLWNLSAGHSRDDSQWKEWSYIYGENIDNISNSSFIQVSRKPNRIYNGNEKITHILSIYYWYNNATLLFWRKWNIWNKAVQANPIYKFQKDATNYEYFLNYSENNQIFSYVWFTGTWVCMVSPMVEADTGIWWNAYRFNMEFKKPYFNSINFNEFPSPSNPGDWTKSTGTWFQIQMFSDDLQIWNGTIVLWQILYIFKHRFIYKINLTTGSMEEFTITSAPISWMTYIWGWFRIYQFDGKMYLWDGSSTETNQVYELDDSVDKVGSMNSMDYYINQKWINYNESVSWKNIYRKVKSKYINHKKFNIQFPKSGNIVSSNGCIYGYELRTHGKYNIVIFWNLIAWSPMSYTVWHVAENYDEIYYIEAGIDGFYISYKDKNGSYWVDFYNLSDIESQTKQNTWFVILREYYQKPISDKNKSSLLTFYLKDLLTINDSVKIEYAIDWWNFQELQTLNHETKFEKWIAWSWKFIFTKMNKEFRVVVFKITLNGNAKLYDIIFDYD